MYSSQRAPRTILKEAGETLAAMMEIICADSGAPVSAFKLSRSEGGWLLMLKAVSQRRGALVCFFGGRTVEDCLDQLESALRTEPGVRWRPDRYG